LLPPNRINAADSRIHKPLGIPSDSTRAENALSGVKHCDEVITKYDDEEKILTAKPPDMKKQTDILKANLEAYITRLEGVRHGLTTGEALEAISNEINHCKAWLKGL
jgi:hypothetical protein